ncbi:hypothetical protein [Aeribacillus pallidus]|uniref:Uncharacterized protein n=1 Tax=Aeribacillus pallidus TaxID=33936 RepID=A0A223E6W8_9BACI|nr:hypothetical protein [Aeribacillus pallidus]ASS91004.1 hypothetical protein AP3564_12935 [Aeribacillus pallidus]
MLRKFIKSFLGHRPYHYSSSSHYHKKHYPRSKYKHDPTSYGHRYYKRKHRSGFGFFSGSYSS